MDVDSSDKLLLREVSCVGLLPLNTNVDWVGGEDGTCEAYPA